MIVADQGERWEFIQPVESSAEVEFGHVTAPLAVPRYSDALREDYTVKLGQ